MRLRSLPNGRAGGGAVSDFDVSHVSLGMDGRPQIGGTTRRYVVSRCDLCGEPGVPEGHNRSMGYPAVRERGPILVRQRCERWSPSGDHRVHHICRPCMSAYNIGRIKKDTKRRCPFEFTDADHTVASMRGKS